MGVIGEIEKNSREKLRLTFSEYRGVQLADLRVWWLDGEEWKPGKGVAIRRELLPQLQELVTAGVAALPADMQPTPEPRRRRSRKQREAGGDEE
jgi:hypothetical protein